MRIIDDVKVVRHSGAVAAGVTDVTDVKGIDCYGFQGVAFIVAMGAITAGAATSIKAQSSTDDGDQDAYADIAGSALTIADTGGGKAYILDVRHPNKRFVRCIVSRATQNSAVDAIVALVYDPIRRPVAVDSDTVGTKTIADALAGTP